MKKILVVLAMGLMLVGCGNKEEVQVEQPVVVEKPVEKIKVDNTYYEVTNKISECWNESYNRAQTFCTNSHEPGSDKFFYIDSKLTNEEDKTIVIRSTYFTEMSDEMWYAYLATEDYDNFVQQACDINVELHDKLVEGLEYQDLEVWFIIDNKKGSDDLVGSLGIENGKVWYDLREDADYAPIINQYR